jgi:transcriptional regulator with XRE-family HTH domain
MIPERLKLIRKAIRYKQKDIAEQLGITASHLSGVEKGKLNPSKTLLKAYCISFNINEDWLISGKGEMFNRPKDERIESVILSELERLLALKEKGGLTDTEYQTFKNNLLAHLKPSKVP